jgi:hypothetical protein
MPPKIDGSETAIRTTAVGQKMNYQIELVARAFYDADDEGLGWDAEPEILKEEFRGYARNAIDLLQTEIGVLPLALDKSQLCEAA